MIYSKIFQNYSQQKKQFALLIDPEKYSEKQIQSLIPIITISDVDMIFIGGSLVSGCFDKTIQLLKSKLNIPVIIFPGSPMQISPFADGILFLSLISGRNPEYLIGNHVLSAKALKQMPLEVIPTGYILIENGKTTSVEYISNTKPIPANKPDIAIATAIAGEMLGLKLMYLEAGSGASECVNTTMIKEVSKNITIPLIVGGGITSKEQVTLTYASGADIIVIGTAIEKNFNLLPELTSAKKG